uniref:Uncharacterized protein n=1 Tax=Glossina brevipalpis TaxID=37001 RepID=A0A1A9W784_9MUSC
MKLNLTQICKKKSNIITRNNNNFASQIYNPMDDLWTAMQYMGHASSKHPTQIFIYLFIIYFLFLVKTNTGAIISIFQLNLRNAGDILVLLFKARCYRCLRAMLTVVWNGLLSNLNAAYMTTTMRTA